MNETVIDEIPGGYLLGLPTSDGWIRLAFEDMEQTRSHQIEADLSVWREIPGASGDTFSARLNILSLSGRETYRRGLDEAFPGPKGHWTRVINLACGLVRDAWRGRPQSIAIDDAPDKSYDTYRHEPFVVSKGPTVWFGDGGAGKTTAALALSRELGRVLYVDYEWDASEIKERLHAMGGSNGLRYMNGAGVPLADQVPAMRREIQQHGTEYVMVDSAALACGGEPEKAEVAIRYFNALKALGIPSLTIAHVTKAGEDQRPFGSAFWSYAPRLTWNIKGNDETEGELRVGFFCRKSNVARKPKPFGMLIAFGDHIRVEVCELWPEFNEYQPSRLRIRDFIQSRGKVQRREISQELGMTDAAVRKALQRMPEARSDGRSPYAHWWLLTTRDTVS